MRQFFTFLFLISVISIGHTQCTFVADDNSYSVTLTLTETNVTIVGNNCSGTNFNYNVGMTYEIDVEGTPPQNTLYNLAVTLACSDDNGDGGPDNFDFQLNRTLQDDTFTVSTGNNQTSTDFTACNDPSVQAFGCSDFIVTINGPQIPNTTEPCNQTILPIKLSSFTAEPNERDQVVLKWRTETEVNNDYFTLEYSKDGIEWKQLTTIEGQGNSEEPTDYTYVDAFPNDKTLYYRLKQNDFDGASTFSAILEVELEELKDMVISYPNPSNDQVTIQTREDFEILAIVDLYGKEYPVIINNINDRQVQLDVSSLEPGFYIVNTDKGSTKFMKQ